MKLIKKSFLSATTDADRAWNILDSQASSKRDKNKAIQTLTDIIGRHLSSGDTQSYIWAAQTAAKLWDNHIIARSEKKISYADFSGLFKVNADSSLFRRSAKPKYSRTRKSKIVEKIF